MDKRDFLRKLGMGAGVVLAGNGIVQATKTLALAPLPKGATGKLLIAHRGASSYAPENTLPAYDLAIKQGADLVEQDLQITKDGVLICMHDSSLEGTTNVEDVFPDRFKLKDSKGKKVKYWPIVDFTLAEIKQLKANSREGKFADTTVPTWQEAIDLIRGRAGLCPETKGPEGYSKLGFDMEKLVAEVLKKNGLDKQGRDKKTPVLMQSFSKAGLQRLRQRGVDQPVLWLEFKGAKNVLGSVAEARRNGFESIGPCKDDVTADVVKAAHAAGLKVIPYTFEPSAVEKRFAGLKAEMSYFLYDIGIDGMFTNNPDIFPREKVG